MQNEPVRNFDKLLERAVALPPKTVAVVNPNNDETFAAIKEAGDVMKTKFVLFGDEKGIVKGLGSSSRESGARMKVVGCAGLAEALNGAVDSLNKGEADVLMKGGIDTSTLMKAVLAEDSGLRTGRRLSDVFVFEYPSGRDARLIMITDGGINLTPDLRGKIELIKNAVDVARALGNQNPHVALLSASEFVNPALQSTLDAAALSKMNERGQIKGCVVDGPLALDNALFPEAAREKGIRSQVAGRADILVAPDIVSANALAKSTTYFANLRLAHVIVGAKVPILIPSRSDKSDAKLLSIALSSLVMDYFGH